MLVEFLNNIQTLPRILSKPHWKTIVCWIADNLEGEAPHTYDSANNNNEYLSVCCFEQRIHGSTEKRESYEAFFLLLRLFKWQNDEAPAPICDRLEQQQFCLTEHGG